MCILCFETLSVESDDEYDSGVFVSGIECIDMSEECKCVDKWFCFECCGQFLRKCRDPETRLLYCPCCRAEWEDLSAENERRNTLHPERPGTS